MSQYATLRDEIKSRVLAAYTRAGYVFEGTPTHYTAQLPRITIIVGQIVRAMVGRSIEQVWTWTISAEVGQDERQAPQDQAITLAYAITNELCPYSEDSSAIPSAPAPFAGIGYQPQVTEIDWMAEAAEDHVAHAVVTFVVKTSQWQ